jgi:predicted ATP-grasp superfamily ATP-dependent carboligase
VSRVRVFVYEYLCARGVADPPSLRAEGTAMLRAVLEDLAACPGVCATTLLGPSPERGEDTKPQVAEPARGEGVEARLEIHANAPEREEALFRELAGRADFTLVIAPEFDDLLYRRCRWAEEEGSRLLGPTSAAVALTADKWELARLWQHASVPTPTTSLASSGSPPASFPLVIKPRFGAGSQDTCRVDTEKDWAGVPREGMIVQPLVDGLPVSVAMLRGLGGTRVLPAVRQCLSEDGRFRYEGGRLPLPASLDRRAGRLARRAAGAVPGLQGYFGIDLVLGPLPDGSADRAIEINPRLTTSYVGLRRLARFNLMRALLGLWDGRPTKARGWHAGEVSFRPDGGVTFTPPPGSLTAPGAALDWKKEIAQGVHSAGGEP